MSVPIKLEIEIKEDENANHSELNDNVNTIMDLYREEFTVRNSYLHIRIKRR